VRCSFAIEKSPTYEVNRRAECKSELNRRLGGGAGCCCFDRSSRNRLYRVPRWKASAEFLFRTTKAGQQADDLEASPEREGVE